VIPYVDVAGYYSSGAINGVIDLSLVVSGCGVNHFNLGFIQSQGGVSGSTIQWAWGGYSGLSESTNDGWQYEGIKANILNVRDAGGDICASFGGAAGTAFWQTSTDVDILANTYSEIVNGYGLTRVDFDIDGSGMVVAAQSANAQAIKRVQDETGVQVTLTVPVAPSGILDNAKETITAYKNAGVKISVVNLMTMCYGQSNADYADLSIQAVDNTAAQLVELGLASAKADAYKLLGTCPSIGYESPSNPFFTVEWMDRQVAHAKQNKLAMVSFWDMNRDAQLDTGGQVKNKYEYSKSALAFVQ
jgi:chitinase